MPQTLTPQLLRRLHIKPADHPRGQPHLSAASGLICMSAQGKSHCFAVADDEHHLAHFSAGDDAPVELYRLLPDDLPDDKKQRKKLKPDLESLCALPAMPGYPYGALILLGSGSKTQRHTGLLMPLNAKSLLDESELKTFKHIDLTVLYAPLHAKFDDLNIEGCFVQGEHAHLLQRGNKGSSGSACIRFKWQELLSWLLDSNRAAPKPQKIIPIDLGEVDGIPLTPTDGINLPDGRWLLSAAAENTDNSFADGPCAGSALALLDANGQVLVAHPMQGAPKVEGIAIDHSENSQRLLMVTDADDPDIASQLLSVDAFWL